MFTLTKEQAYKVLVWAETLPTADTGAAGGRFTYSFTPTRLGTIIVVEDVITKNKIDVTDYDEW